MLRSSSSQIRGQLVKSCRLYAKLPHKVFETLHCEGFHLSKNTFASTEACENLLGYQKLVTDLFTPYHAIVFGIMFISGGASLWLLGHENEFIKDQK